jgi:hypothetical protein
MQAVSERSPAELCTVEALATLFQPAVDRIIGPAYQGYAGREDFRPAASDGTIRLLNAADDARLRSFAEACAPAEWQASAIIYDHPLLFGRFIADELVAAGTLEASGERIYSVGIVSHPAQRGHGHAHALVSWMTAYGIAQGKILRYQTLYANAASVAVARALGYRARATTIAIRLGESHLAAADALGRRYRAPGTEA